LETTVLASPADVALERYIANPSTSPNFSWAWTARLSCSLDQFAGDIAGDVECFGNGSPLRDEAGKFV
jgi:hypothetical protein